MAGKIELLAPGGNLEKLKFALIYGADAVYIAGGTYGLRARAGNFSKEEMIEGIEFAHALGKKVYVTMNIIPRNEDFEGMAEYVRELKDIGADAVIVSDPGIFQIVRENAPDMHIHISTQANNTNYMSANFWHKMGASRIILARELSVNEIKEIREKTDKDLELEAFVHGAMCMAYSGRCLLSGYMAGRDSNRGDCAQPCRWKYSLVEEKRPGEYYPVYENERGTFIFNSKDLCLLEYIPQLVEAGIGSFKIEGRMKSSYYVATVVRVYRKAIDSYLKDPEGWEFKPEWLEEVEKVSHREYSTGFFTGDANPSDTQNYKTSSYIRGYDFVGLVRDYDEETGRATIEQRNKILVGDKLEVISPNGDDFSQVVTYMWDEEGSRIESTPHPQMIFQMKMTRPVEKYTMLRRAGKEKD